MELEYVKFVFIFEVLLIQSFFFISLVGSDGFDDILGHFLELIEGFAHLFIVLAVVKIVAHFVHDL